MHSVVRGVVRSVGRGHVRLGRLANGEDRGELRMTRIWHIDEVPEGAKVPDPVSWLNEETRCQAAKQKENLMWRQCQQYRQRNSLYCYQHRASW